MVHAPPTGGTDAAAPKAAPKSAANICNKDTLTRCRACCDAACGQSAPHNTSLARAYSAASGADTSDSLRCDARSTRRAGGTRAPQHLTCASHACAQLAYAPRVADRRRRCGGLQALGVLSRPRPRPRPRYSQGPSLPSAFGVVWRGGRDASGARLQRGDQGGRERASALASSGGAPAAPWYRREGSLWRPVVEKKSKWTRQCNPPRAGDTLAPGKRSGMTKRYTCHPLHR